MMLDGLLNGPMMRNGIEICCLSDSIQLICTDMCYLSYILMHLVVNQRATFSLDCIEGLSIKTKCLVPFENCTFPSFLWNYLIE